MVFRQIFQMLDQHLDQEGKSQSKVRGLIGNQLEDLLVHF